MTNKMIKIRTIVEHMKERQTKINRELCKQNLYSEQVAFDPSVAELSLLFCTEDEINKAFDKITR